MDGYEVTWQFDEYDEKFDEVGIVADDEKNFHLIFPFLALIGCSISNAYVDMNK